MSVFFTAGFRCHCCFRCIFFIRFCCLSGFCLRRLGRFFFLCIRRLCFFRLRSFGFLRLGRLFVFSLRRICFLDSFRMLRLFRLRLFRFRRFLFFRFSRLAFLGRRFFSCLRSLLLSFFGFFLLRGLCRLCLFRC